MAEDVAIALTSSLSRRAQYAVLKNVCWEWTEIEGKYEGCKWWTVDAVRAYTSKSNEGRRSRRKGLRHEHAVPIKVVIEQLFELQNQNPTPELVLALLERQLVAVVVTKDQDRLLGKLHKASMPEGFYDSAPESRDPWLRYTAFNDLGFERCPLTKQDFDQIAKDGRLPAIVRRLLEGT